MRRFIRRPADDLLTALERVLLGDSPLAGVLLMLVGIVATWFVYVPLHELLHAAGCLATGGRVTELAISPQYGGAILAGWIPWVVSGSEYAGQLTGFETHGNDWIYLATDFAPFLLTVLVGVPLLRACTRRRRPLLFGVALVVATAPFTSIPGDCFEMGSILATRFVSLATDGFGPLTVYADLRSDDALLLVGRIVSAPAELHLGGDVGTRVFALLVSLVSLVLGILLALATYALGDLLARRWVGPAPAYDFAALARGRRSGGD